MSLSQGIGVRRPSRRTIATGAAWAVPVIAVGAAAPSMAASPNEPPIFELDEDASCKFPGRSESEFEYGYNLIFNVTAPTTGVLCITDVTVPNLGAGETAEILFVGPVDGDGDSECTTVPEGTSQLRVVVGSTNSAEGTATFTGSFNGVIGTFAAEFINFRPCQAVGG